jgi:hypothetical protein
VFDFQGREVATKVNEHQNEGYHSVQLDAANLLGGIYFYSIQAGQYHDTKKFILLK